MRIDGAGKSVVGLAPIDLDKTPKPQPALLANSSGEKTPTAPFAPAQNEETNAPLPTTMPEPLLVHDSFGFGLPVGTAEQQQQDLQQVPCNALHPQLYSFPITESLTASDLTTMMDPTMNSTMYPMTNPMVDPMSQSMGFTYAQYPFPDFGSIDTTMMADLAPLPQLSGAVDLDFIPMTMEDYQMSNMVLDALGEGLGVSDIPCDYPLDNSTTNGEPADGDVHMQGQ